MELSYDMAIEKHVHDPWKERACTWNHAAFYAATMVPEDMLGGFRCRGVQSSSYDDRKS